jgi:hypothetical protein
MPNKVIECNRLLASWFLTDVLMRLWSKVSGLKTTTATQALYEKLIALDKVSDPLTSLITIWPKLTDDEQNLLNERTIEFEMLFCPSCLQHVWRSVKLSDKKAVIDILEKTIIPRTK